MTLAVSLGGLEANLSAASKAAWIAARQQLFSFVAAVAEAANTAEPVSLEAWAGPDGIRFSLSDSPGEPMTETECLNRLGLCNGRVVDLPDRTTLRLARELVILRRLALPTKDPEHIAAMLRNKVDRLAPWPPDQALFGFRVRPGEGNAADVDVAIAGRQAVEALKAKLSAIGVHADAVEADTASGPVTLERNTPLGIRRRAVRMIRAYAAGMLVVSLLFGASLAFETRQAARMNDAHTRLGAEAVAALLSGEARPDPGAALLARREARPPQLVLLREITRALPEDSWLTSLNIADGRVDLAGEARDAPSLIGALQGIGMRDAAFSAPSIRSDDGRSSFEISARLPGQAEQ